MSYLQILVFPLSFLGHDAIVTLLKHYKRPQDESPCNEYSQPGGGMGWAIILFKGPDPKIAEISGIAPPMSESFGSVLSGTNKTIVVGLPIFWPYTGSFWGCSHPAAQCAVPGTVRNTSCIPAQASSHQMCWCVCLNSHPSLLIVSGIIDSLIYQHHHFCCRWTPSFHSVLYSRRFLCVGAIPSGED